MLLLPLLLLLPLSPLVTIPVSRLKYDESAAVAPAAPLDPGVTVLDEERYDKLAGEEDSSTEEDMSMMPPSVVVNISDINRSVTRVKFTTYHIHIHILSDKNLVDKHNWMNIWID